MPVPICGVAGSLVASVGPPAFRASFPARSQIVAAVGTQPRRTPPLAHAFLPDAVDLSGRADRDHRQEKSKRNRDAAKLPAGSGNDLKGQSKSAQPFGRAALSKELRQL